MSRRVAGLSRMSGSDLMTETALDNCRCNVRHASGFHADVPGGAEHLFRGEPRRAVRTRVSSSSGTPNTASARVPCWRRYGRPPPGRTEAPRHVACSHSRATAPRPWE